MNTFTTVYKQLKPVLLQMKNINYGGFKVGAKSFIDYFNNDFETNLKKYEDKAGASSVRLASIITAKHRSLFLEANLRAVTPFLKSLLSRKKDFEDAGKENNFTVACCFYLFYLAFIVKLIDVYFNAKISFSGSGSGTLSLADLGVDSSLLRYFESIPDLREKSVDDWLNADFEDKDVKYITSSIKRVFLIMGYKK